MAISTKEKQEARKAGFRAKSPKKPKRNASLSVLENYLSRVKEYERKVKDAAAKYRKREALAKKIFN